MIDVVFAGTVTVAAIAGLFMAWSIGAVAIGGGAFAPAVGANAVSVMRAAFLLGVVGFFGAVLQGASVTETLGEGLVRNGTPTPLAGSVAILIAATLMGIGSVGNYPIPAAFTVTGAMVGAGIALGGAPAWATYGQFAALWILAPILVGLFSYLIARLLVRDDLPARYGVSAVVAVLFLALAVLEFTFFGPAGSSRSIAGVVAARGPGPPIVAWLGVPLGGAVAGTYIGYRSVLRRGERRTVRQLLVWLGLLVAFSGAGNQIGLAVGPLLPLLDAMALSEGVVLVVASVGLVAGAWTGAPRLINAVAREYASLTLSRSIAALLPAFIVAQIGIQYGVPVSFNEIIVSAIIGSGLAKGGAGAVSPRKLYFTVAAWLASLVGSFTVTYGVVRLLAS